ncbi:polysaccharide deacetylase family protein [Planococcus sp. S3-L1]|uniref:polysaccharide deacetylase family protein n=1 Tax=Planococcus sp. S3-L1 TaxID=3046200 RepID=UPI0024B947EE|nr:polysaccharide deacetylase family protein [Planococcus sp. S3-L1]MDJ0332277.1 polysaccharide deacetylase family protein [Planococcus sp. S3-L1]
MNRKKLKRRSFWINTFLLFFIGILTISTFSLMTMATKKDNASTSEANKVTVPTKIMFNTSESDIPGIKIVTETSTDASAPFVLQYPQTEYSTHNKAVFQYIERAKENYLTKTQNGKVEGDLTISYEIISHSSKKYSIALTTNRVIGEASEQQRIESFHWNLETGENFTIKDVLENDSKHLMMLSTLVRHNLYNNSTLSNEFSQDKIRLETQPTWENFDQFVVTDKSITFYFAESEEEIGLVNSIVTTIPLTTINELLAEPFQLLIEEDEVTQAPAETTKKVALTFDDGPNPKTTVQILEILNKYDAKATFFMLGNRVQAYPEIAKQVREEGHEISNHSWNHPDLTKLSTEKVQREIQDTNTIIEMVTGEKSTSFRPPYGAVNAAVRQQTNLPIVLWDVDTLDWQDRDAHQLLVNVKRDVKGGSIILMHDIHQSTADGLDAVLAYLQSEDYTFVKASDL